LEYFEQRATGKVCHFSRLFLYKTARRLLHLKGDTGVSLRSTWKAVVRFGLPPEEYLPYEVARYDDEPEPFLYSCARRFESLHYVRLDPYPAQGEKILRNVKAYLAAGFACTFGFPVTNLPSVDGNILFPRPMDSYQVGQAVVAVGFDDRRRIGGAPKGALLIRSSWGERWGEGGYGWLPYEYVHKHLAADFWTLIKPDWLASGEFTRPSL
jgi:C1A family cysteine protease